MNTKKLTILSLYVALSLIIFMIEAALPGLAPIPGVKLGLANIITLLVIKRYGMKDATLVLFVRIILAGIFAGQAVSILYSISGGLLCLITMGFIVKLIGKKYIFIVSIFGAIAHNMGQILAALIILKLGGIIAYVPYLIVSGVITGLFTGLVCYFADKYIPQDKIFGDNKNDIRKKY